MCETISVSLAVTRGKFEDAQLLRFSDEVFSCVLNLGNFAAIVVQVLRVFSGRAFDSLPQKYFYTGGYILIHRN